MTKMLIDRAVVEQALHVATAAGYPVALIAALKAALAEPVQEPVAWRFQSAVGGWAYGSQPPLGSKYPVHPLYTAPPQRKPLDDLAIADIYTKWDATPGVSMADFARAVERAHGIGGEA